jgi:hypothetical protein
VAVDSILEQSVRPTVLQATLIYLDGPINAHARTNEINALLGTNRFVDLAVAML